MDKKHGAKKSCDPKKRKGYTEWQEKSDEIGWR